MRLRYILFILIILIAGFLRFFQLGQNPPSLTWDETAWGYNAYAIGLDAKDEFGKFLPVQYLESFGDFKPPMYAYLTVLPVKLFGLTEFATRFPSGLFGVFTVIVAYFLTKQIFYNSKYKESYSLAAMFILAISPWHIMLSRAAFEANVATFFLATGVWLFLLAVQAKPWMLSLSALSFVLSLYTFNSARVVAPLLVIVMAVIFWKRLWKNKTAAVVAIIVGLVVIAPIARFLISPQAGLRFQEVNIFSDIDVIKMSNQEIVNDHNAKWSEIIHNRRWLYTLSFFRHYFDNLNPNFLFIKGDGNPKFSTQDVGEVYLIDLPFFIVGIFMLFKKKEGFWYIIPLWLILGIIPAATARETPHALRIEATLPTFQIFIAYGLVEVVGMLSVVRNKRWIYAIYGLFSFLLIANVAYFLHGYYANYAQEFSGEWQYGYKDSIQYVQSVQKQYDNIFITDALGRPYIYYLFYMKIDPAYFRANSVVHRDAFGFVTVEQFGKYHFVSNLDNPAFTKQPASLFINTAGSQPHNAHVLQTFYLLNGKPTLVAYTL